MKLSVQLAFLFAGIYMLAELVLLMSGIEFTAKTIQLMLGLNSIMLLLAVALSILIHFNKNKAGGLSMIVDLKMGIAAAGVYALVISTFLVLYFSYFNPSYPEERKQAMLEMMQDEEAIAELDEKIKENPEMYEGKSVDDIKEQNMDNVTALMSAKTVFPIALFSLLMLGMIYSFFIMAFNRVILSKL